jgi:hypothetical protein
MTEAKKPRRKAKTRADRVTRKRPFDIEKAIRLLREAMTPYPKAVLFEMAWDPSAPISPWGSSATCR